MRMGPFVPDIRLTRGPVPRDRYLSNVRRPIFTIRQTSSTVNHSSAVPPFKAARQAARAAAAAHSPPLTLALSLRRRLRRSAGAKNPGLGPPGLRPVSSAQARRPCSRCRIVRCRAEPVKAVCDRRATAPAELPGGRTREDDLDRTSPAQEVAAIGTRDMSGQELRRREVNRGGHDGWRMGEASWVCGGALAMVCLRRWQSAAVPLRRDQGYLIQARDKKAQQGCLRSPDPPEGIAMDATSPEDLAGRRAVSDSIVGERFISLGWGCLLSAGRSGAWRGFIDFAVSTPFGPV